MMLYPPVADLAEKVGSRYLLVNLVARRARDIAAKAEEEGEPLDEKPVSEAIEEVYAGKLVVDENGSDDGSAENEAEATSEPAAEDSADKD
ncbi:MAG TPA: DNA-directed RNA polymerase subunit omega [Firmicutes bacterium]|nr:DNA-directed RNA polymerase subunit omega [Bacillota bacterium]